MMDEVEKDGKLPTKRKGSTTRKAKIQGRNQNKNKAIINEYPQQLLRD